MVKQIGRFITLVAIVLLASCQQVKYIPVQSQVRDTIYRDNVRIDSFISLDSVYVTMVAKGDTVTITKTKVVYRDKYKYIHDTTYISRVDTIRVPVPVEHKPMVWERITDRFTVLIGAIIIVGFLLWFIGLLRRQK